MGKARPFHDIKGLGLQIQQVKEKNYVLKKNTFWSLL
jgi:hypothetical protein